MKVLHVCYLCTVAVERIWYFRLSQIERAIGIVTVKLEQTVNLNANVISDHSKNKQHLNYLISVKSMLNLCFNRKVCVK